MHTPFKWVRNPQRIEFGVLTPEFVEQRLRVAPGRRIVTAGDARDEVATGVCPRLLRQIDSDQSVRFGAGQVSQN